MLKKQDEVKNYLANVIILTLYVLIFINLRKIYDFDEDTRNLEKNHTLFYRDALQLIFENLLVIFLTKYISFFNIILFASVRKIKDFVKELKDYMSEIMIEQRSTLHKFNVVVKNNLISILLKALESRNDNERNVLSNEKIFDNLFIYNFVRHDIIANIFLYCFYLLLVELEI